MADVREFPPEFDEFYKIAYDHIGKAMKAMSEDERGKSLDRHDMLMALAHACVRAAALSLSPSNVTEEEIEYLADQLPGFVATMRRAAAKRGLIAGERLQ